MKELSKQHVQIPNMNLKEQGLIMSDPYVYACIKKYMNSATNQAYPQVSTIVKDSGLDRKTILKSIKRLEEAKYFTVQKRPGTSSIYTFNDYKKFEIFSFDFLEDKDLTPKEKAYIVAVQQYMFKDSNTNKGQISFTNEDLAEKIGLSLPSLKKYEDTLKDKNVLTLVRLENIDKTTGLNTNLRIYDFEKYLNIIALKFKEVDTAIENQNTKIEQLQKEVDTLQKTITVLLKEKQLAEMEKKGKLVDIIL